jgi:flagellar hook-associated protein 1 FlgK
MMSLFNILNLGAGSLDAETTASSVTGENLSNVNNPAYARQVVNLSASTPLNTPVGQEGTGVTVDSIQEIRDALLDGQIQAEAGVTGSLNAQQGALQNAEAALAEQLTNTSTSGSDSSPTGLAADLSNFFNALQSLSSSPTDVSLRQGVIGAAQQLTSQFNTVASSLSGLTTTINSSIDSDVSGANQDLSQIASLNAGIVQAQAIGGTANELIDQREQALEDLASKVNFTTTTQSNGAVDVTIGGVAMVSNITETDSLAAGYNPNTGRYTVKAQNANTYLNLAGGSIEGDITVRDGAIAQLQTGLDTLASQISTSVNSIYSAGFDLHGNTGQNFFTGNTAAGIGINSTLVADPTTFQASGTAGATGDNSVALALAQLANTPNANLNGQTINANYAATVANLGSALSSVNVQVTNNGAMTQMLSNQRQSVSGVNIDEEMTNLMQFQKAYEASAELITTINQMLQTVVNMKTT